MASNQDTELQDWLALTKYDNLEHRRKCLKWWADKKAMDKKAAELEEQLKELNQRRAQLSVQLRDDLITETIVNDTGTRCDTNIDYPHSDNELSGLKRCRSAELSAFGAEEPPAKAFKTTARLNADYISRNGHIIVLTLPPELPSVSRRRRQRKSSRWRTCCRSCAQCSE